ncbi:MAG: 3'-5' exonuclease [Gemmatimonadota bacterium]
MSRSRQSPVEGLEIRPTGILVEHALRRLEVGPASTADLAADVLALRGNPRAAAAAVFALLGSDRRVQVDSQGVWCLVEAPSPVAEVPLMSQDWVVVDVETTGGSPAHGHRVIEVAAVQVSDGRITESFSSLVNPGRPVPRMITSLTGIENHMLAGAPPFEAIAPELSETLGGRVFVGHNATFDWRFVSAEMERCLSRTLDGRRLCTLRLARRLLPHLPSRSLGALAEYFDLRMESHHRALDDALATARLLLRFLEQLEEQEVRDWRTLEKFFARRAAKRRRSARPTPMDAA